MKEARRHTGHSSAGGWGPPAFAWAEEGVAAPRFLTVSWAAEIGILLALSLMFPFLIHVLPVPEDTRLGARLLPMFYAPLLAALLGRPRSALLVAAAAPWLNWALTSHPTPLTGTLMTVQLLAFVVAVLMLQTRLGRRWYLALPAYLGGMAAAALVAALVPELIAGRSAIDWTGQSIARSLPGIGVLLLINWLAVQMYPSGPGGGPPLAT